MTSSRRDRLKPIVIGDGTLLLDKDSGTDILLTLKRQSTINNFYLPLLADNLKEVKLWLLKARR